MKILYYDCFSGISGDMNLGALVDLGVPGDYLASELEKLNIDDEFELKIKKGIKKGISGTKVDVVLKHEEHDHGHHHDHAHRNLKDIEKIIDSSDLSKDIKELAKKIFLQVAEAEAKVHGKSIDEVHFHEVGATDSIVDIVGAAICMEYLKVDKVMASSVQLGGGFVTCAHGKIPVPAPATVEILKDAPVKTGLVDAETTTPTGAAILAATVDEFSDCTEFVIRKTGYGLGFKDFEVPNVLRVCLAQDLDDSVTQKEKQYIIETNIDDMNPELYEYLEERLFSAGALDVYKTPIVMKKGRMATKLSILTNTQNEEKLIDIIFQETTSIGFRKYEVEKLMLERDIQVVKTKFGDIRVKRVYYKGSFLKQKAEYEDCKKAALENNVSIKEVYDEVDLCNKKDNNKTK